MLRRTLVVSRFNEAMIFRPWKAKTSRSFGWQGISFNEAMIFRPWKDTVTRDTGTRETGFNEAMIFRPWKGTLPLAQLHN